MISVERHEESAAGHLALHGAGVRSAVSNRSRLLQGVDGRSAAARRFRDILRRIRGGSRR